MGGMVEMLDSSDSSDSGGIMESVESNNFYNLGTTLTTGHLAKLHLAVSQSLLAQELMGAHGIKQLSQPIDNWHNFLVLHGIMESVESVESLDSDSLFPLALSSHLV